jgi:uncharacterized membrane protein YfcA
MPVSDLALIALVIAFASYVQAISGFGFALLAVPLMGLAIDIRLAVVVSTLSAVSTNAVHAWNDREVANKQVAKRIILSAFVGMPIGLAVLVWFSQEQLQLLVGITVLVVTLLLVRRVHVPTSRSFYDVIAGFISGVLATSVSTNGPPLVVVLQAKKMPADEFRATLNVVFAIVGIISLGMFALAGRITSDAAVATLWAAPGLAAGLWGGRRIRGRISESQFQKMVLVLLAATGLASVLGAIL